MLLTDFWLLDGFLAVYPPADVLLAARWGYKPPEQDGKKLSLREAARMNSEALSKMPVRKNIRTLSQMPAFLRTPDQLKMIADMEKEWRTSSE